jgi:tRNA-splicing ligase RtcB
MIEIVGKYSTARVMTDELVLPELEYKQALSFVNCHVFTKDSVIMPDYHYGAGCMIGFTSELTDKVIPNVIGVDIGCNMLYVDFGTHMDWDVAKKMQVDKAIRELTPMSFNHHPHPKMNMEREFPWSISSLAGEMFTSRLNSKFKTNHKFQGYDVRWFEKLCDRINIKTYVATNSIGTLGGGNHFIEFSESKATGNTGVTLHAGSRGFGLKIAKYHQKVAKQRLKERQSTVEQAAIAEIKATEHRVKWNDMIKRIKLPPTPVGLEYLEGDDWYNYLIEMNFAQIYAEINLNVMMQRLLKRLGLKSTLMMSPNTVHTIHNYVSPDDLIIRKGAVRSIEGERMLVPANMEDGILVCEGRSNEEWNFSAPHGAGRLFGRKAMKKREDIDVDVIRKRMNDKGIFTSVLPKDEVKEAYKSIEFIERVIGPTATIVDKLVPILNLKADD